MSNFPKLLCCNDSIKIYTSLLQQNEHIVSQTLSLHDPASLQRMHVPCRAFDCEHLQCFDYSVILQLNKSNERSFFKCSVCNETRNPDKIYIDFVTFCLLRMYKCSESFKLYRDGTLRPSGPISPEYKGMEINTVFDIKKLCVLPDFQSSAIHLRQLLYTSVFDINDYINKSGSAVLLKLITKGCRKLPSKDAELTLGIDKLRPFNSNTWLGLQHSFQTLPSVGDKKGASLVKDLREEYDKVSLNHLNKITSGPLDAEDNAAMMTCGSVYEIKKMEDVMVDLCGDDDDEETPVRPFIKTALEAPSSSSLSTAVPTTAPQSAAPSSSSSTSSNRQLDTPNASDGHNHANHQGSAISTASNNASSVEPTACLNKPCRKPLTGANAPGGASTAVICRGELGQSMQGRLPRVQRSVEMRPSGAPTRTPVVSHLDDRIAAFNRWFLLECVTQSTQTECMDGSSFTDMISHSSATEKSISSGPFDRSSYSTGVSMDGSTDTPLETSSASRAHGGLENPTLYWLEPTFTLMGDHGPSNQNQPAHCHDEMDDDAHAILCAQIDQMDSEATGAFHERMESDRERHVSTNFEGYEFNSNYSSSDCESVSDNVILDQNQNQNQNYDRSNISDTYEGDTNASALSSDRSLISQPRDDPVNMQNSRPNVEINILNSLITTSNTGGTRDQGFDSSSSRDDVTPGQENSVIQTDKIDHSSNGVIIGVVDDWTIRLVDSASASTWAPGTATSAADIIAAATAPVGVRSAVDDLAAHENHGPCPALTTTAIDTVTAGMAIASGHSDNAVAVDSNGTLSNGSRLYLEQPTSEEIMEAIPDDSGDTTESEDDMFDLRGSATRKIKKAALGLTQAPADSVVVIGEAGSPWIAVEGEQSDAMRREVIPAACPEIEPETELDVDEDSQALSSSQSTVNATQSAVDTTGPVIDSVSLEDIAASTESIPSTADTGIPSTISAVSAVVDSTSAASSAESTIHVPDASMSSTSSATPFLPETTAMEISDPSSSSVAPVQSPISSSEKDISGDGIIPIPSSSHMEMPAEPTMPSDATRVMNSATRTAPSSTHNERIYNSGRCNTTATAPSVPALGPRRKTPLDISSSSSAESINQTVSIISSINRTLSNNINRDSAQLSVHSTVPPSSSSSLVVPTVTGAAAPISELLPTAASSVLRQMLPSLAPLNIPTDTILQSSASTLTAPTLIPFSSTHSSTIISLATPASSTSIAPPTPTVQAAVTVLPAVSVVPLLTPPLLNNQMATVPRREAEHAAAVDVAKDISPEPHTVTIPKRKSAAASPRIAEIQDPIASPPQSEEKRLAEEKRAAEKAAKNAEKRRKVKKYGPTPDGIAEWAYHLAKGTQCKDLLIAKRETKNVVVPNTKKKQEQWYRAVARLTADGHYDADEEEENFPAAVVFSSSSSSSSSATPAIAIEVPVPSQPTVHATTVADWKCGKCRRIIDGNKRLCTECNTARPSEVTARTTDILRRCQSCSITPSTLPCAACAAMVPAIRAAFKPMTVVPKAGKERRSALAHEKPPYVEPVIMEVGPNKRPLLSEGLNGAPSDQDNKNKAKTTAKKAVNAKETAMYMAALKGAPSPAAVRNTTTQHPTGKAKKAKIVPAASSSSSVHSTAGALSGAAIVAPSSASVTARADAPMGNTVAAAAPVAKAAAPASSSSASSLFIDLTLDDDDDIDEFGRAKQTPPPTLPCVKSTSVAQDSSVKRKHSTAFGGDADPSQSGDTAGTKIKAVKKVREAGSNPNPPSRAGNAAATVQPKPPSQSNAKFPPPSVAHNASSSNTASTGHPRPPTTPHPNYLSSLRANATWSSINPSHSVIPRSITGQSSQLNFSLNSAQARPVPANISDTQETSFSDLCANDFSLP
jgi:hypothetical protein